jgi:hypothetical protein
MTHAMPIALSPDLIPVIAEDDAGEGAVRNRMLSPDLAPYHAVLLIAARAYLANCLEPFSALGDTLPRRWATSLKGQLRRLQLYARSLIFLTALKLEADHPLPPPRPRAERQSTPTPEKVEKTTNGTGELGRTRFRMFDTRSRSARAHTGKGSARPKPEHDGGVSVRGLMGRFLAVAAVLTDPESHARRFRRQLAKLDVDARIDMIWHPSAPLAQYPDNVLAQSTSAFWAGIWEDKEPAMRSREAMNLEFAYIDLTVEILRQMGLYARPPPPS